MPALAHVVPLTTVEGVFTYAVPPSWTRRRSPVRAWSCRLVDGGVTPENAGEATDAGADILVAASAIFRGDIAANIEAFRRTQMRVV